MNGHSSGEMRKPAHEEQEHVPREAEQAGAENGRPIRALAVDDEPVICEVICEALSCDGFCVETRHNGDQALDRLKHGGIDLLVTDLNMPGCDGISLIKELETWDDGARPAIVVVSAWLTQAGAETFRNGAVHAALSKPFQSDDLVACCRSAVATRRKRTE